jgi:branched-chain amino acid transport system permease protein
MSAPAPAAARSVSLADATRPSPLRLYGVWVAAAVVLAVLPYVLRAPAAVPVVNQMGIAVVFALSYNMMLGQGGMLSFGHAVYFGFGGFFAAHALNLAARQGLWLPVPLVPIMGGLGGMLFAAVVGSFSTNRAGTVFAMISLGIAEMMAASSLIFDRFFGGEEGITTNRAKAASLGGLSFSTDRDVYYLIAFWVLVSAGAMYAFSRTPVGRMANAVRDNPERAEFVGYSQRWVRYVSFCASGLFAGVAGGLFAVNYEILTAENMGLGASGAVLLMTYIGGIGTFAGPVLGAIVFTFLQSMLSDYTSVWLLYLGLVFLAVVLFLPFGLAGVLAMHDSARRNRRLGRLVGPYAVAAAVTLIAVIGLIGCLEMVYFFVSAPAGQVTKRLFWLTLNVRTATPWLAFLALIVLGGLGMRWAGPRAAAAFADASLPGAAR